MSDRSKLLIKLTSSLAAFYGVMFGLIYIFRWHYEHSVSEWLTVILYIGVIVFYIRDIQRYFGFYPIVLFLLIINRELSLSHTTAEVFGIDELYKMQVFKVIILLPVFAVVAVGMRRSAGNILVFLRQMRYLCFLLAMVIVALSSQIADRFNIPTRFWLSFEEAGEVFLPMMFLLLFVLLRSEVIFQELERR